jgi:hypothetical protein
VREGGEEEEEEEEERKSWRERERGKEKEEEEEEEEERKRGRKGNDDYNQASSEWDLTHLERMKMLFHPPHKHPRHAHQLPSPQFPILATPRVQRHGPFLKELVHLCTHNLALGVERPDEGKRRDVNRAEVFRAQVFRADKWCASAFITSPSAHRAQIPRDRFNSGICKHACTLATAWYVMLATVWYVTPHLMFS